MKTNHSPLTAAFLHHQSELRQHLLRRVGCSDTADDLLQDTFLRIAQLESGCEIVNPRAFLYRVAGNLALDHLRWQARRQVWDVGPPDEEWPCPCPQPDRLLRPAAMAGGPSPTNRLAAGQPPNAVCLSSGRQKSAANRRRAARFGTSRRTCAAPDRTITGRRQAGQWLNSPINVKNFFGQGWAFRPLVRLK